MEEEILIQKTTVITLFNAIAMRYYSHIKALNRPPAQQHMTLLIFTCLLTSKSDKENETIFEGRHKWLYLLKNPMNVVVILEEFLDNIDTDLNNRLCFLKMQDLKRRIKEFNKNNQYYWDYNLAENQSIVGHRMMIANDAIFKLWDLKSHIVSFKK